MRKKKEGLAEVFWAGSRPQEVAACNMYPASTPCGGEIWKTAKKVA